MFKKIKTSKKNSPSKLSLDTIDDPDAPEINSLNFLRILSTAVLSSVSFMLYLCTTITNHSCLENHGTPIV